MNAGLLVDRAARPVYVDRFEAVKEMVQRRCAVAGCGTILAQANAMMTCYRHQEESDATLKLRAALRSAWAEKPKAGKVKPGRACSTPECGRPLNQNNLSGRCAGCMGRSMRALRCAVPGCARMISADNRCGVCFEHRRIAEAKRPSTSIKLAAQRSQRVTV